MTNKYTRVRIYEKESLTEPAKLIADMHLLEPGNRIVMLPANIKRPNASIATVLEIVVGNDESQLQE